MSDLYFVGFKDITLKDEKRSRTLNVAIWYPTDVTPTIQNYFGQHYSCVSKDAEIIYKTFPVLFISHGSKGHRFNQHYLAERIAETGFIVISIEHPYDNAFNADHSNLQCNLNNRPEDLLFVVTKLCKWSFLKTCMDYSSVFFMGHSFGGYTCMNLAQKNALSHMINLRGLILFAPAYHPTYFDDFHTLDEQTHVLLFTSEQDELLHNVDKAYLQLATNITHYELKGAGHYVYLMRCSEALKEICPEICLDHNVDRQQIHQFLIVTVINFLNSHCHSSLEVV